MSESVCLVTVTTSDYLARALALCHRAQTFDQDLHCRIYVLGSVSNSADVAAPTVQCLQIPERLLDTPVTELCRTHTATEMCCLLKPVALLDALDHFDIAFYCDTDMYLCASMDIAKEELGASSVLLTPHLFTVLPQDGKVPDEFTILSSGTFNAGFIAARKSATPALHWWREHLQQGCYIDYARMMNADQKWLDLMPQLFNDIRVSTHPGINCGYWTTSQFATTTAAVADYPLMCFHFSGLDPNDIAGVSKHQNRIQNHPQITEMAQLYLAGIAEFSSYNQPCDLKFRTSKVRRTVQWVSDFFWRIHDGIARRWPAA